MEHKKAFLLLNGEPPKKIPNLLNYQYICATDGAYHFLEKNQIQPHLVSGDFDSIKKIPEGVEVISTPNQNYTDFDKILSILKEKGFTAVDVYGAGGKEHDHFLGNISTAMQWKNTLHISFFDDFGTYFLAQKKEKLTAVLNKTISLIPLPIVKGITTKGLQYPLQNETLTFGKRIGTRNKAIANTVEITFDKGELLLFINA